MGLFDNLKNAAINAAQELKEGYEEANAKDIMTLCEEYKELKKLDPKRASISLVIRDKSGELDNDALEDLYDELKKMGSFFTPHPAKKIIEDELVERNIYIRKMGEDTVVRNSAYKRRKK